jgi:transposase-like protein
MSHKSEDYKLTAVKHYLVEDKTQEEVCQIFQCSRRSGLKYANLKENITKAIENTPQTYYKNILEGAYNRKEKFVEKNKTRKNPKKLYL